MIHIRIGGQSLIVWTLNPTRIVSHLKSSKRCEVFSALYCSLGEGASSFGPETRLLGEIPEMDSMAVVSIITELEERFGFEVMDDEISADSFETFGDLTMFVHGKLSEA